MQAIRVLLKEQSLITEAVDLATRWIQGSPRGKIPDQSFFAGLLPLLENFAGRHYFSKIDEVLLPWIEDRLETRYPEISRWLEIEQESARAYLARVRAALESEDARSLSEHLSAFSWLTRWQLDMHSNVLISIAKRLGDEDDDHLLLQYDQVAPEGRHERAEAERILKVLRHRLDAENISEFGPRLLEAAV